jgi:hypothetical protein
MGVALRLNGVCVTFRARMARVRVDASALARADTRAAEHGALERFEPIDLAFRLSFEHTARCDISSGQSESPASQEPPELEAPAAVTSANCAAIRKLPAARTRSTSLTLCGYDPEVPMECDALHDNPGPEHQLRCLRHPPDYAETANQGKIEHEK